MSLLTEKVPAGVTAPNGDQTNNRVGHHVGTSVPQNEAIPLLNTMNARGRRIAAAYYESGVVAGIAIGRQQAEDELAAIQRRAHAVVQHAVRQPTWADLCERRGEPQRAQRQRDELRRRGITA